MALPQNISISSAISNPQDNEIRIHSPFVIVTSQIVDIRLIFIQPNFILSFLSLSPKFDQWPKHITNGNVVNLTIMGPHPCFITVSSDV